MSRRQLRKLEQALTTVLDEFTEAYVQGLLLEGERKSVFILDDTGFPKKGDKSVGR